MDNQDLLRMPAVIGVGLMRSGTTWLDELLRAHPEIQMPHHTKELDFFSFHYDKGVSCYVSNYFPIKPGSKIWGDISPTYITNKEHVNRIKTLLPEAKIIISLRNLYDLTVSIYNHYLRYGGAKTGLYNALKADVEV